MEKAIFLPQGAVPILNIIEFKGGLDWLRKTIGCRNITYACPYALEGIQGLENVDIVCDDEGLLNDDFQINYVGSVLYGTRDYRMPLVGNCLIVAVDGNGNTTGLTNEQIGLIFKYLAK